MTDLGDLRIPVAMRPTAAQVIRLTDKVCADLLEQEYAALARQAVAKLARKRPSPLQSGRAATWAGGVVWALGQVNFLSDRSTEPHYLKGIIPYVPSLGRDGTAAAMAAQRS